MSEGFAIQPESPETSDQVKPVLANLDWLVRYASHCRFRFSNPGSEVRDLRAAFGAAAWRIVCRSPKSAFMPILSRRELSIHSLITYCKRLAQHSFLQAPQPLLLHFFVIQRRYFHDRPCRVPESDDYALMRIADRESHLRLRDIAAVSNWAHQTNAWIRPAHKWSTLVSRAHQYFESQRLELQTQAHEGWHFYCRALSWRGLTISPLTGPLQLWQQGHRHGNCLYKLRFECSALQPSRFFCISHGAQTLATLELAWRPPQASDRGMDRVWGHWFLQDLRLSYNRVADDSLLQAMTAFARQYNIWAKRPGRQTPEVLADTTERVERLSGRGRYSRWKPLFSGG